MANPRPEDELLSAAAKYATKVIVSSSKGVKNIANLLESIDTLYQNPPKKAASMKEPIVVHRFVGDPEGITETGYINLQLTGDSMSSLLAEVADTVSSYEDVEGYDVISVTTSWQEEDYVGSIVIRYYE